MGTASVMRAARTSVCARGCTKRLLEPVCVDELCRPEKPFQKPLRALFVHIGQSFRGKWLQKPMEAQQWEMAPLAFSYSLYVPGVAFAGRRTDDPGAQFLCGGHCASLR